MKAIAGTTLLRFGDELLRTLLTRDAACNRLSLEVGEPDADGVCVATVTVHYDDNPLMLEHEVSAWLAGHCRFSMPSTGEIGYPLVTATVAAETMAAARAAVAS